MGKKQKVVVDNIEPKTLEQKRIDEAALVKKHDIARLGGKLRRKEITQAEFDEAMKAIK